MADSQRKMMEAPGTSPLPSCLHGLDRSFPEIVYILYDLKSDRHIMMDAHHPNMDYPEAIEEHFEGLACFCLFDEAQCAACELCGGQDQSFEPVPIPFETARSIAKSKTRDLAALVLVDSPVHPLVHFVR